jgi:5'-nucleotidase
MTSYTDTAELRFLCANDVYKPARFSKFKTLVDIYGKTIPCKKILAGDFLGGSRFAVLDQGRAVIDVTNAAGFDYAVLGNHEFDYGADRLEQLVPLSHFKWLGSNVRYASNGEIFHCTTDYDTFEIDCINSDNKIKVGVFGVCTENTPALVGGKSLDKIVFENVLDHASRCIGILQDQKCNIIIALTHVSLTIDKIIGDMEGVDIIIGGHDHIPSLNVQNGTYIIKCGQDLDNLGIVDLHITRYRNGSVDVKKSFQLLSTHHISTDPIVDGVINDILMKRKNDIHYDERDELPISTVSIDGPLSTRCVDVRSCETAFPCYLCDAVAWSYRILGYECHLGIFNGGFIRGDNTYDAGTEITPIMIREELPFPRGAVMIRMKAKDIKLGIEQMLSHASPTNPVGSFPHLSSNFHVTYDLKSEPLDRVKSLIICNEDYLTDPDRYYNIAVSDFYHSNGGDGVTIFTTQELIADNKTKAQDVLIEYLKAVDGPKEMNGAPPQRLIRLK